MAQAKARLFRIAFAQQKNVKAMSKTKICAVCAVLPPTPHYHHIYPQCFGGKNGPLVLLCPNCHNGIHASASATLSYIRSGGKNKIKQFWNNHEEELNAAPYINAIVSLAQTYEGEKNYKMLIELDSETYNALRFLKKDLAQSSLQATLKYCILHTHQQCSTIVPKTKQRQLW